MNSKIFFRASCLLIILAVVLWTFCGVPAFATPNTEIEFGKVNGVAGEEVVVPVIIKDNPGISTFRFRVTYDTEMLTFVSVEKGGVLSEGSLASTSDEQSKSVTFLWYSVSNVYEDGDLVYIRFMINDNASGKYSLNVNYLAEDILNASSSAIACNVTNGEIQIGTSVSGTITSYMGNVNSSNDVTVRLLSGEQEIASVTTNDTTYVFEGIAPGEYVLEVSKEDHVTREYTVIVASEEVIQDVKIHLLGDVNGDGKVNATDKKKVYAHINDNSKVLTGYEFLVADVNGDGKVNATDKKKIFAHINGNTLW